MAGALDTVRRRIATACAAAGRDPAGVTLVAVSKTFGVEAIRAALAAGQRDFGESYVQEALPKIAALAGSGARWHFVGPLQSNKTAEVARHFDWVHGVDREKIARRLSAQRPAGLAPLQACVQVNISAEATKSGVPPAAAGPLCHTVAALPNLRLRGLMAIPAPIIGDAPLYAGDAPPYQGKGARPQLSGDARLPYRRLRDLLEALRREGLELDTLSAGMSDDLEAAIAEGSTLVRVGTAIFGARMA